jgi:hypothetical protein
MKVKLIVIYFLIFICAHHNSFPQIEKGSWQLGMSSASLFELSSSGLNGGLINFHAEHMFSNRFIAGIQPYYAFTHENKTFAYDLTLRQPRNIRKDVFHSLGINAELKFVINNGPKLTPYSAVIFGAGYSSYHLYHNNVFAELVPVDLGHFVNYNLGIGIGTYIKISNKCSIDTSTMYAEVGASKDIKPSSYLYPSIGIMKVF